MADLPVPSDIRTEADVDRVIEAGRGDSAFTRTFLTLLDERHAIYHGVGTPAVIRMRGALLLALGHRALPSTALPFVLEELESAHDPWLTAVAASVLRKSPQPSPAWADPLLSALFYIRHRDEIVHFPAEMDAHRQRREPTTATTEVLKTIAWLGGAGIRCIARLEQLLAENPGPLTSARVRDTIEAIRRDQQSAVEDLDDPDDPDDAHVASDATSASASSSSIDVADLPLQDHAGIRLSFADAFHGRTSIVVFFYTRCDNPTKCPLTMYRFGELQRSVSESGVGDSIALAAITYDPAYDSADRLLHYAESWGVKPSATHRILRTVSDFGRLSEYFSLGVNYSASGIVNRHQLEAFILDTRGRIVHAVTRRRWDHTHLLRLALQAHS